uniref:DUF554 domain-containing protein n=1 Tax=Candidatus Enterococcus willemsii TaxID=1857215 RepID=UPI00403F7AEC
MLYFCLKQKGGTRVLSGVLVNSAAIIIGGFLGAILRNITEEMKDTVTKGIGLGVLVLGIQMAIKTQLFTLMIISLCIGAMIGEWVDIENRMNRLGLFLEKHFARSDSNFAEGFVTASLIFVIGSMGIIGSIESGVSGNHATLYTKAVMDGFLSIMLTASLGVGVLFSAIPIFLYQGTIVLAASVLVRLIPPELMTELMGEISAIGGIMILGIGVNILKLSYIRVSNFLPGIVVMILLMCVQYVYF